MSALLHDLRAAARALLRAPGLALVAVVTIALGVGANATVFAWLNGVVLAPFPAVRAPAALATVGTATGGGALEKMAYADYLAWREARTALDGLAAFGMERFGVRDASPGEGGETLPVWGNFVTPEYFRLLGVRPALGRMLDAGAASGDDADVVVLGHALWRTRFASDSTIVGRRIWVNGAPLTVVGVAPAGFLGTLAGLRFGLWLPIALQPRLGEGGDKLRAVDTRWLFGVGRLQPGVSVQGARLALVERWHESGRAPAVAAGDDRVPAVEPLDAGQARRMTGPVFALLLAVTGLVQLVVCANVANLLLVRVARRRRELAVRAALGADRAALVRPLLLESLLLAALGGALGLAVAHATRHALRFVVPRVATMPIGAEFPIDVRVLGFGLALAGGTAVVAGLAPALRATRLQVVDALRDRDRSGRGVRERAPRALVAGQLALAFVALVAAGLFTRALDVLRHLDAGLHAPSRVVLLSTELGLVGRRPEGPGPDEVERLVEALARVPGVTAVGAASDLPLDLSWNTLMDLRAEGAPEAGVRAVPTIRVAGGLLPALGVGLREGRDLGPGDGAQTAPVAVISAALADRYWPGRSALGRRLEFGGRAATVVGVTADVRFRALGDGVRAGDPLVFVPFAQWPSTAVTLFVRTAGAPAPLLQTLRAALREADPGVPLLDVTTLAEHGELGLVVQRLAARVLGVLGAGALFLGALGLYGVTAYAVAQRGRELAIRVALGASPRSVIVMVVRDGGRLALVGLAAGLPLAYAVGRLARAQLVGVAPIDPLAFGAGALFLAGIACLAAWASAARAAPRQPAAVLRAD